MVLSNLDRDLLARCLQGTPEAWEDFVDRFLGLITFVVTEVARTRSLELTPTQRDDLVSDIFLVLIDHDYRTLRKFRGQSSLGTYLVVVARRIAVRKLAQLQRTRQVGLASEPASHGPSDELLSANREEVQALLEKLPGSEATAMRMFHLEELSYREIGMHMGIPENSVGPLLSQARAKLRQLVASRAPS